MRSEYRLKKRQDFQRVFKSGNSIANRHFVLYMLSGRGSHLPPRLGISISKKVAKQAVVRNRMRRLIKEAIRTWMDELPGGWDFIVIARSSSIQLTYSQVNDSLRHLFRKARLLSEHGRA